MNALAVVVGVLLAQSPRHTPVVLAVQKSAPAVVNISSEHVVEQSPFGGLRDPLFDQYFRDFFEPRRERTSTSLGSGVIVSADGLVITNEHVISRATRVRVTLADERELEAEVLGADPEYDLAALRIITNEPLPAVDMGSSGDLLIGETVIAIGNPFGLSHTVTTGVVSAINRSVKADKKVFGNLIQTDASINPGNSGGPLLNIEGKLIGINTAIYESGQGIGFAIPVDRVRAAIDEIVTHGEVRAAWLGMQVGAATGALRRHVDSGPNAAVVLEVHEGGPAAAAGIEPGDVVLAVNGKRTDAVEQFDAATDALVSGESLAVQLSRGGERRTVQLAVAPMPEQVALKVAEGELGVRVEPLSARTRRRLGVRREEGVVIAEVDPRSYAARIGLRAGDLVARVQARPVTDLASFAEAMARFHRSRAVTLLVFRDGQGYHVTLPLN